MLWVADGTGKALVADFVVFIKGPDKGITPEEAATKIQASVQGALTRKQLRHGNADRFADPTRDAKLSARQRKRLRAALDALCGVEGGGPEWAKLVALADQRGGRMTIDELKAGCRETLGLSAEQLPDGVIASLFREVEQHAADIGDPMAQERRGEVNAEMLVLVTTKILEQSMMSTRVAGSSSGNVFVELPSSAGPAYSANAAIAGIAPTSELDDSACSAEGLEFASPGRYLFSPFLASSLSSKTTTEAVPLPFMLTPAESDRAIAPSSNGVADGELHSQPNAGQWDAWKGIL